jgi:oxaloacetate decarboxylase alpha subunit
MTEIRFADTTIRDGPLSLWANNMRTGMMLAVAEDLDRAGFESIEVAYTQPKKMVRELKEDPWEALRLIRTRITETPLRTINSRFKAFELAPTVLYEIMLECLARVGIRQARLSDEWNQVESWRWKVDLARSVGIDPVVNLIFALSPKHTDEYYAERARQAASLDVHRLCLKDPGGLLTPDRMRTLVPAILAAVGDRYVEFHGHCSVGFGQLNALEAASLGIRTINTGVPPLANGTALPNIFSLAGNLRIQGFEPVFEEAPLRRVEGTLTTIAKREGLPIGGPVELDMTPYAHQIPGGMLTNLRHQLGLLGLEQRFDETREECASVREEWGYPIMVTPLSQFVGTQAALNIIAGERYRDVTDQAILFALGRWGGEEAIQGMDPDVRDRILNRPRARELAAAEPPQYSRKEIRKRYASPGMSDEEMLLRMEVLEEEIAAMRSAGPPREYPTAEKPLVALVRELTRPHGRAFVAVEVGGTRVTVARKAGPSSEGRMTPTGGAPQEAPQPGG